MQLLHVTAFWLRLAGNILLDLFLYVHIVLLPSCAREIIRRLILLPVARAVYRRSSAFIGVPTGFALERLRDAERLYKKTNTGRARDTDQELHNAERAGS